MVSLPDNNFVRQVLEKLEFYVAIDFFLSETARYADVVLPGSLQEEDEGTVTQTEGRVIKINKAVEPPGETREPTGGSSRTSPGRSAASGASRSESRRDLRGAARRLARAASPTTPGITYERIEQQYGVFWPCPAEVPERVTAAGTAGHGRGCSSRARGTRSPAARARSTSPTARRASTSDAVSPPAEDVDAEYPIMLTTGRVVSQFLSGTQTRRIGPLVDQYPEPRIEMHPRLAATLGIADGDWVTAESRRGALHVARLGRHARSAPTRCSSRTTGRAARAPTS